IRDTVEKSEQLRVSLVRARVLAEEPPTAHAGRAAERVDLEAGVVGDGREAARGGIPARLRGCVLRIRGGVLVGLRRHRLEVARRGELEVEALKDLAVLAKLSAVCRAEKENVPVLSPARHPFMVALAGSSRTPKRASGPGAHQFARPRRRIVAGTTRARTIVASSATATARPRPTDLMITTSASANATKTPTMIAAAPVMSRPPRSSPPAPDAVVSPVRRYSS